MDVQKIKEFFKQVQVLLSVEIILIELPLSENGEADKEQLVEVLKNDQQKITSIIEKLTNQQCSEATEIVYSNLFTLYHNGDDVQKVFVFHFLPVLIWEYLFISSNHGKKGYGKLEAVLLAIYNAEVLNEEGEIKFQKFRLPSLSQPSTYHEPLLGKMSTSALTESALSRHEQTEVVYRLMGPGYKLSRIPACHRFAVVAFVLEQYNLFISFMGEASLHAACKMALRAASCGFKNMCEKNDSLEGLSNYSRIPLDNNTIVQLVYIVYYAMHNGYSQPSIQAFEALHFRAAQGLFPQAFQLTLSIENLLNSGKSQSLDAPLGLTVQTTCSKPVLRNITDKEKLPRCFNPSRNSWERECPYEILLTERPVLSKLESDANPSKLKIPKDTKPRKVKSWVGSPSAKNSPTSPKSPGAREPDNAKLQTVSIEMSETRNCNIELLTGL